MAKDAWLALRLPNRYNESSSSRITLNALANRKTFVLSIWPEVRTESTNTVFQPYLLSLDTSRELLFFIHLLSTSFKRCQYQLLVSLIAEGINRSAPKHVSDRSNSNGISGINNRCRPLPGRFSLHEMPGDLSQQWNKENAYERGLAVSNICQEWNKQDNWQKQCLQLETPHSLVTSYIIYGIPK